MSAHLGEDYRPLVQLERKDLDWIDHVAIVHDTGEVTRIKHADHAAELAEALEDLLNRNSVSAAASARHALNKYKQSRGEG